MRRQSTLLLLSIVLVAAACSKSNYARVEPDDLYFTHKDRKKALAEQPVQSTDIAPTEDDLAVPVNPEPYVGDQTPYPYYNSTINPDNLYGESYEGEELGSSQYYDKAYAYQDPYADKPVVNNYYYSNGWSDNYWAGYPSFSFSYWPTYGSYNVYSSYYRPVWADPYYSYYTSYWYRPYYGPYMTSMFSFGTPGYYYSPYYSYNYYGGYYGNSVYYYENSHATGIAAPRKSRNSVSYYVDKGNVQIKRRRADYIPSGGEGGRMASTVNSSDVVRSRRADYLSNKTKTVTRRSDERRTAQHYQTRERTLPESTLQQYRNRNQGRNRTVVTAGNKQTAYASRTNNATVNRSGISNSDSRRQTSYRSPVSRPSYTNRNANRPSVNTNRSGRTSNRSYNTGSRSGSSSYGTRSRSNTSGRSYTPSRSSGRSYTPNRSSSGSRSSYSGSRSSTGSRSSYTPSRSSGSTRSSGSSGRSSGNSSSKSRSTTKRN